MVSGTEAAPSPKLNSWNKLLSAIDLQHYSKNDDRPQINASPAMASNIPSYDTLDVLRMPHPLQENDVKHLTLQELSGLSLKISEILSYQWGGKLPQYSALKSSFETLKAMISERSRTGTPPLAQSNPANPNQRSGAWPRTPGTPAGAPASTNDGYANGPGMRPRGSGVPSADGTVPNFMGQGDPLRTGRREAPERAQNNPQAQPYANQAGSRGSNPFNNFDTPRPSGPAGAPQGHKHGELYTILGLTPAATHEDIVREGKKMKAHWHPDRNKEPNAEGQFKKVNEATEVLSDPRRRQCYDATGKTSEGDCEEWENASRGMGGSGGMSGRNGGGYGGGYGARYGGGYAEGYGGYGGYQNFYGGGYRSW